MGAEHPNTLTARVKLANWTGKPGMRPGPGTSTPRCCRSVERVLGAEHPETLTTRSNMASWTRLAQNHE